MVPLITMGMPVVAVMASAREPFRLRIEAVKAVHRVCEGKPP